RRNGCAQAIVRAHRDGHTVVGICGGYQMLGQTISDPDGIEGTIASLPGLGLLPIHTTMTAEKTTQQVTFQFEGQECYGYEIHQGISDTDQAIMQTDHCIGTYIHGFLDNAPVIDFLLKDKAVGSAPLQSYAALNSSRACSRSEVEASSDFSRSITAFKEEQYNKLADHVRQHVDMDSIYKILTDD
ncbi:MAG: hypothetical protein IKO67_02395, partial [Bacteroidaceae bacterium]|nr:hypothetical protein [Bacteroidaceae bacterium]